MTNIISVIVVHNSLDRIFYYRGVLLSSKSFDTLVTGLFSFFLLLFIVIILSLSPLARKQIYWPMVSDFDNNIAAVRAIFLADHLDDYFANSGLSTETIDLIKKLSFPYAKVIVFCDVRLVLDTLKTPSQKSRVTRNRKRRRTRRSFSGACPTAPASPKTCRTRLKSPWRPPLWRFPTWR